MISGTEDEASRGASAIQESFELKILPVLQEMHHLRYDCSCIQTITRCFNKNVSLRGNFSLKN